MSIEQERLAYEAWIDLHPLAYPGIEHDAFIAGYRSALQSQDWEDAELLAIGRAIYRACSDLPNGWEVRIDLEKDSGIVYAIGPLGDETMSENDDTFSSQVNEAIDHARRIEGDGE